MTATLDLFSQDQTHRLADLLAARAEPGLTLLLDGPVGAGKTTLARRIIQSRLAASGKMEDVPSPTFTIVQTYEADGLEIWHADLYRLTSTSELFELGLDAAFDSAFCMVEWPDRLGDANPPALRLDLGYGGTQDARSCTLSANSAPTQALLEDLTKAFRNDI